MPDSVAGVLIFIWFLLPGFVFLLRRESRLVGRKYTALREVGLVLAVSTCTNTVALACLGLAHRALPDRTPSLGYVLTNLDDALQTDYRAIVVWGGIGLLVSCSMAAVAGCPPTKALQKLCDQSVSPAASAWADRMLRGTIIYESAWSSAFTMYPDVNPTVGCTLVDGTFVTGPLYSFNPDLDEVPTRSLVLAAPIGIRAPGDEKVESVDVGTAVIGADQIRYLLVSYPENEQVEVHFGRGADSSSRETEVPSENVD